MYTPYHYDYIPSNPNIIPVTPLPYTPGPRLNLVSIPGYKYEIHALYSFRSPCQSDTHSPITIYCVEMKHERPLPTMTNIPMQANTTQPLLHTNATQIRRKRLRPIERDKRDHTRISSAQDEKGPRSYGTVGLLSLLFSKVCRFDCVTGYEDICRVLGDTAANDVSCLCLLYLGWLGSQIVKSNDLRTELEKVLITLDG